MPWGAMTERANWFVSLNWNRQNFSVQAVAASLAFRPHSPFGEIVPPPAPDFRKVSPSNERSLSESSENGPKPPAYLKPLHLPSDALTPTTRSGPHSRLVSTRVPTYSSSPPSKTLAVRTKLLVDSVDAYVLAMPSPVNRQRRACTRSCANDRAS